MHGCSGIGRLCSSGRATPESGRALPGLCLIVTWLEPGMRLAFQALGICLAMPVKSATLAWQGNASDQVRNAALEHDD